MADLVRVEQGALAFYRPRRWRHGRRRGDRVNAAEIDRFKNRERQRRWRERHQSCPEMQRANEERQQGYALLREKGVPFVEARRRPVARQALLEFIDRERRELGEMGWREVVPGTWETSPNG